MAAARVPRDTGFATKPALAGKLVISARDADVPARWVAGDEVYGSDGKLRRALQERGIGYVLAIARTHQVITGIGARRAIDLAVRLPACTAPDGRIFSSGRGHLAASTAISDMWPFPAASKDGTSYPSPSPQPWRPTWSRPATY